ncbi:MAG: hypothetical protein NVS3B25_09950 [Hymenobacter sp.]
MANAGSATTESVTQLLGTIKNTYAKQIQDNRVTSHVGLDLFKVDKEIPLSTQGFNIPILVAHSQSTTYDNSQGTQSLTTQTAPQSVNVVVTPKELSERFTVPFGMLAQAAMGQQVSFVTEYSLKMLAIWEALERQAEQSIWYGGTYFAVNSSATTFAANSSVLTLSPGSFSPAYLAGCLNAPVDLYSANGATKYTANGAAVVSGVDIVAGTMTITVISNTDQTTINTNQATAIQVWRYNEKGFGTVGLCAQLANTTTALFAGMDPTAYNVLKANVFAAVGNLSLTKVVKYVATAKNMGLKGKARVFVCPDAFSAFANELTGLRRFDGSFSKGKLESGAETIDLRVGNVTMSITEVPFLKTSEVYCCAEDSILRPGVSDITDSIGDLDLQIMSAGSNGFEFRVWTSWNLIATAPAQGFCLQGCTYPAA